MRPWLVPVAVGLTAAVAWTATPFLDVLYLFGPGGMDEPGVIRTLLKELARQGVGAFVVGFGVACATLAYRNTLAQRRPA